MKRHQRGQAAVFLLVFLSLVSLGFLALAVDVGRMYAIQSELQAAADAAALSAATRLIGTLNSAANATVTGNAPFDTTTGRDNKFNLNTISFASAATLATSVAVDYFSYVADARTASNGGQAGPDARYARVDIEVETPAFLTRFLSPNQQQRPRVRASAIAGVGPPLCTVCGMDGIAVAALDTADEQNYGFFPGESYTLYLNLGQQRPNLAACPSQAPAPLAGTLQSVEYSILNHTPVGTVTDADGLLFRLGAGGLSPLSDIENVPACVTIGATETLMPDIQGTTCADQRPVARNLACGLNTRFGADTTGTACDNIAGIDDLRLAFAADTDVGAPAEAAQLYASEYDGNTRRVITVAIVDATANLTVLNFRQFLLQNDVTTPGVAVNNFRGPLRAQYIGAPVPVRLGTAAGACGVARGVGKVVLHQ
jgi:Flp pilus assembly protein TadG